MTRRLLLPALLLFAVSLSACDTTELLEPATVSVVAPVADQMLTVGDAAVEIDLAESFETDATTLLFEARSDGDAVRVELVGDVVIVQPIAVGSATVVIVGRGANGGEATDEFAVEVVPACFDAPADNQVSYLPLAIGDVQTFDYEYRDQNSSGPTELVRSGTLTWTIDSVSECDRGRQVYTASETLAGTEQDFLNGALISEDPFSRSATVEFVVEGDSALVPYSDEPVLRFGPASDPADDRYSFFAPDCVWGSCRTGGSRSETGMTLSVGDGIVRRIYSRSYSAGGQESETLTRRSAD